MKDVLSVPWWAWAATIGVIAVILGTELAIGLRRGAREVTLREAAEIGRASCRERVFNWV